MHEQQSHSAPKLGYWNVPTTLYLIAVFVFLGSAAFVASTNMVTDQPNRDIWQHLAALRALSDNLTNPINPFVVSDEISRHFHPLWIGMAAIGKTFGLTPWAQLYVASYLSMAIFGLGVFAFARVYFQMLWAPSVLLMTMLFAWWFQVQHTGMHSFETLLYGAAYPATFLIGLSFLLWAVTIRALDDRRFLVLIVPLVAFNFATHQLGAVIGLVGVGSFVLLWPNASLRNRVLVSMATLAGLGLAMLWPYYNPLMLVLEPGNSSWDGGPDFYGRVYLTWPFIPAVFGLMGFRGPRGRSLALMLVIYVALFSIGFTGLKVAGRFLMPVVLVLHIGLAAFILRVAMQGQIRAALLRIVGGAALAGGCLLYWVALTDFQAAYRAVAARAPNTYDAAQSLTDDIPDDVPVAAFGIAAWPVVGNGQRVHSVPWPEPGISDLGSRQDNTKLLFDAALSLSQRVAMAREMGVRVLIVDVRTVQGSVLDVLTSQAVRVDSQSTLRRFDLYD